MSWVSTAVYYDRINRLVQKRAAHQANAPLIVESLNFADFGDWREKRDWALATRLLVEAARRLEQAGAEGLVITANTMHKVYDEVAASVSVPVIDVFKAVADEVCSSRWRRVALIGTRTVMADEELRSRLTNRGIDLTEPERENVDAIEHIIYEELMLGRVTRDAERRMRTIFTRKAQTGVEAIILACTELEAVVDTDANVLPIFDSTDIHCHAAARFVLGDDG
jgi:aspartate racemase